MALNSTKPTAAKKSATAKTVKQSPTQPAQPTRPVQQRAQQMVSKQSPAKPLPPSALGEVRGKQLPDEVQALFAICEDKLGFVPNVFRSLTLDSAKLHHFRALYNDLMLADSPLSKLEREMIAVVVSAENRCHYCLVAHGAAVRVLSGNPALGDTLVANYRAALPSLPPHQRAMLNFAHKLTAHPDTITDADRAALKKAGFSAQAILHITLVVGLFNLSNRLAAATDMRPNDEYYVMGRGENH